MTKNNCRVAEYVETHLDEELTLCDMAKICGRGTERFRRCFKAVNGASPKAYLIQRRVAAAAKMIEAGAALSEVTYACGFGSQARFTVMFKAVMGVTPGAYRKMRQRAGEVALCLFLLMTDWLEFAADLGTALPVVTAL